MARVTKDMLEDEIKFLRKRIKRLEDELYLSRQEVSILKTQPNFNVITACMSLNKTAREMIDKALTLRRFR